MLVVKGLELAYGDKKIFDGFDLSVSDGEIVCVLGRSGCGKTSLLNCIAGALPYGGSITGAEDGVAYIFQEPRLISGLTAAQNVKFAVSHALKDRERENQLIDSAFEKLGLSGLQNAFPEELSGGQAARVSLARAFCHPSDVLLMDEPFGSLDIAVRLSLTEYISALALQRPRTTLMVSHGIEECLDLADRVIVLGGRPCRILREIKIGERRGERSSMPERARITDEIRAALLSE